jgi:hypothetical protein
MSNGSITELLKGLPPWMKAVVLALLLSPGWYGGVADFFGLGKTDDKVDKSYHLFVLRAKHTEKELDSLRREMEQLRMLVMYSAMGKEHSHAPTPTSELDDLLGSPVDAEAPSLKPIEELLKKATPDVKFEAKSKKLAQQRPLLPKAL